ncbi:MAG: pseudaminic acid cytidylyltransferase [Lachnospiraceae bacterium]|nr:pseudaminic acid cytidylyltransferase [Lachnospiraceae bacterium]
MKTLAVITARGGSKRIHRKNIKPFLGKPILLYSIQAALASGVFDEVMVSTEDEEIAEIARKAGAKVPFFRSGDTANDYATTADVLLEVLEQYRELGVQFDYICCIYPTAPFVSAERLKEAMEKLTAQEADALLPVVRFSFPPQRSVVMGEDGFLQFKWQEYMLARSQDLEPFYHDAGQFYCLKTESFLAQKKLVMAKTVPMELPESEVQDIDTEEDWRIAEAKYKALYGEEKEHGTDKD